VTKKGGHGYTYWKRNIPDAHLLPSCEPQKISPPEVSAYEYKRGPSLWNSSGATWEERDCWRTVKESLNRYLTDLTFYSAGDDFLRIASIKECTGEATLCYVRRRGRLGFDINMSANFTGIVNGIAVEGDLDACDITDHDPSFAVTVVCADIGMCELAKKSFTDVVMSTLKKVESDLCRNTD